MRTTEITVEILILSLSKDEDFGPATYFATGPSMGKLSGHTAGLMGWNRRPTRPHRRRTGRGAGRRTTVGLNQAGAAGGAQFIFRPRPFR